MKSRIELYLENLTKDSTASLPQPVSRVDKLLCAIITGDNEEIEKPQSTIEEYLNYILENGVLSGGNLSNNNKCLDTKDNIDIKVVKA